MYLRKDVKEERKDHYGLIEQLNPQLRRSNCTGEGTEKVMNIRTICAIREL